MSTTELNTAAATYFDLIAQIEQLQAEAEAIKDTMRGAMIDRGTEELEGTGWRATWHNVQSSRFDSKRFKTDHADLYGAYTVRTNTTRFTLNQVRA